MKPVKNESGQVFIMIIVAMGLLGGLSMVLINIMGRISAGNREAGSLQDRVQLTREVNSLLASENHCRASLAGGGTPVTFKKEDIDGADEGLDVELWTSNTAGNARAAKKFSGTDSSKNKLGRLTIHLIRLRLDSSTGALPINKTVSDIGKVIVGVRRTISGGQGRDYDLEFPLSVTASTDNSGVSTLVSCSQKMGGSSCYSVNEGGKTFVGCGGTGDAVASSGTLVGFAAGAALTGNYNTFLGYQAGGTSVSAQNNVFVGYEAGKNSQGNDNTFAGYRAGMSNTSGQRNTFVGRQAGEGMSAGSGNILIGNLAAPESSAGLSVAGDRQLNIGNLIFGRLPSSGGNPPDVDSSGADLVVNSGMKVEGGVSVGADSSVCGNSKKGILRSNSAGDALEFCDGTSWKELGCQDSSWTPGEDTVCSGTSFTQTSNCGNTKTATGTKSCACIDSTWTPTAADKCTDHTFTQTSNCGNTRTTSGTESALNTMTIRGTRCSSTSVCNSTACEQGMGDFVGYDYSTGRRIMVINYCYIVKNVGSCGPGQASCECGCIAEYCIH